MLMSRASRLAIEALVELSEQGSQELMNAAELGQRIDAELPFLKQVLNRLTRNDLVRARPGRSGGYQLARRSQTLSLSAVAQAITGRDVQQQCLSDSSSCDVSRNCRVSRIWHAMRESLHAFLETETIHSIAGRSRSWVDRFELSEMNQPADH